ncbi:competence protein ComGB [Chryseomicrobium aureum]|uniref:type II secretion system F family protein n=1 Tax=Chryseomicrobium aureum TaxID=1441723 RepID=UPI0019574DE5|nr:type II secretion system F family protein [Chryseomicrobium aureum]MBM7705723.1 competence protein ComGB [Chryseomicrobium aureum]
MHPQAQAELLDKLAVTIEEGISSTDALFILTPFYLSSDKVDELKRLFEEGGELSMGFHYLGYSSAIVESIKLAEVHGQISRIFKVTAHNLRVRYNLKQKAIRTLSYPVGLLFFMSLLFVVFKLYFLPIFRPIIERANPEAVTYVEIVFSLPFYFITGAAILFVMMACVIGSMRRKPNTHRFRQFRIIRKYQNELTGYMLSKDLSMLLESGFTIAESLRYMESNRSELLKSSATATLFHLNSGHSFSKAMHLSGWFTKALIRYVEYGEIHGYIAKELELFQEFTMDTLERKVTKAIAIMQPVLFLVLGALVVSAYLSLMLPMYNLLSL